MILIYDIIWKYKIKSQKIKIRLCVIWASHVTLYQIPKFYAINWPGINFSHNPNLLNVVKKQVKVKSKRSLARKNEFSQLEHSGQSSC